MVDACPAHGVWHRLGRGFGGVVVHEGPQVHFVGHTADFVFGDEQHFGVAGVKHAGGMGGGFDKDGVDVADVHPGTGTGRCGDGAHAGEVGFGQAAAESSGAEEREHVHPTHGAQGDGFVWVFASVAMEPGQHEGGHVFGVAAGFGPSCGVVDAAERGHGRGEGNGEVEVADDAVDADAASEDAAGYGFFHPVRAGVEGVVAGECHGTESGAQAGGAVAAEGDDEALGAQILV